MNMLSRTDESIIRRLRDERDEAIETARQLRDELSRLKMAEPVEAAVPAAWRRFPADWPITPTIRSILAALSRGATVPPRRLYEIAEAYCSCIGSIAIGENRSGGGSEDPTGVIRTQISKHRKALRSIGIEVRNRWGEGYYLEGESLEIVRAALRRVTEGGE